MIQPDVAFVLKIQEAVHSIEFLSQQLLTGCANGKIKIFCLSVSFKILLSDTQCFPSTLY